MILFELKCSKGHFFEAWFKDGKSFERQAKQGKVECPMCEDSKITKAPMAPAVTSSKRIVTIRISGRRTRFISPFTRYRNTRILTKNRITE